MEDLLIKGADFEGGSVEIMIYSAKYHNYYFGAGVGGGVESLADFLLKYLSLDMARKLCYNMLSRIPEKPRGGKIGRR